MAEAATRQDTVVEEKRGLFRPLLLLALMLLIGACGGLWASGSLSSLLGRHGSSHGADTAAVPARPHPPVFMDMPEIIANLNTDGRRASYIKLRSKLELSRAEDVKVVEAMLPRLLDLFTTYLREMRPEELRGSAGTYRLREELMARANIALASGASGRKPSARVTDVLFLEILQQ